MTGVNRKVIIANFCDEPEEWENALEFRLTYEGVLRPSNVGRSHIKQKQLREHKNDIRLVFHRQMRELWHQHPNLKDQRVGGLVEGPLLYEEYADDYESNGVRWVPLVIKRLALLCKIDIVMLRYDGPGSIINSADIDNRLKTLFDALKRPNQRQELPENYRPSSDENPFFVLLEDDELISKVTLEADRLLEPPPSCVTEQHYVKLMIHVSLARSQSMIDNFDFI